MSGVRSRPRRRLRSEALPLSVAVLVPLALAWMFPYGALSSSEAEGTVRSSPAAAACAFVELDREAEIRALAAARTAWHVNSEGVKRLRLEMFADDLPDDASGPVMGIAQRTRFSRDVPVSYEPLSPPTDLRAAPPSKLGKPDTPAPALPFPRDELLKLVD